jgi:Family of unknown function (DUF5681)
MLNPASSPAEQVGPGDTPPLSARVPKNISALIEAGEGTRFKKGFSGNPKGRPPNAGLSVRENWNLMAGWTREELKAVFDDPAASASKLSAATTWLNAIEQGADHSLINIVEFTSGKAVSTMDVNVVSDWEGDGQISVSPETLALQRHLAKRLEERREQQALPPA